MPAGRLNRLIETLRTLGGGGELSDGQLLECFVAEREESAFEALVRRHGPMVLGVCQRLLHHAQDAEDAFQATFLVLARKADSVKPRERVANWLYGVAYNTARKARSVVVKRRAREKQMSEPPVPLVMTDDAWADVQGVLDEELSRLPENYRLALVLCAIEGKPYNEVAGQLGCAEGTVCSWLTRGRKLLAARLARRGLPVSLATLSLLLSERATAGIPPALIASITRAGILFATGRAATPLVSTKVVALARASLSTLLKSRLKFMAILAVLLVLGASAVGLGVSMALGPENSPGPGTIPVVTPAPAGQEPGPDDKEEGGQGRTVRIPFEPGTPVTFGPVGCPVAVVGPRVWALDQGQPMRELEGGYDSRGLQVLSTSGRWFAATSRSPNHMDTTVTVWSVETGRRALEVPGRKEAYVDVLAFGGERYLILGGRHEKVLDLWDIESRKKARSIPVPGRVAEAEKFAVSPDGQSLGCSTRDNVILVDRQTGREVVVMAPPRVPAPGDRGERRPRSAFLEVVFVQAWSQGLAFSPDGKELAQFTGHPWPRLLCWDRSGELLLDARVSMPRIVGHGNSFEWLPDRSGWLINGYLVERTSSRVVLHVRSALVSEALPHVLDRNRLLAVIRSNPAQLQTVTIPWPALKSSLHQMRERVPAFLGPGQAVSIETDIQAPSRDEKETSRALTETLTDRLHQDDIRVAPGQSTRFRLKLTETAGDRGEVEGVAVLELLARGRSSPLWSCRLTAYSSRSSLRPKKITPWQSMLDHLTGQIKALDTPIFMPRSSDVPTLPVVIE
jgi:RNA polymerase sigma factor (sigma-70 family)